MPITLIHMIPEVITGNTSHRTSIILHRPPLPTQITLFLIRQSQISLIPVPLRRDPDSGRTTSGLPRIAPQFAY